MKCCGYRYLDLSANELSGTISTSLFTLSRLLLFDVSDNKLRGTIASSLSRALALQTLDLDSNLLTGTIPLALATLGDLQYLNLGDNSLVGAVPNYLTRLESSTFDGNCLDDCSYSRQAWCPICSPGDHLSYSPQPTPSCASLRIPSGPYDCKPDPAAISGITIGAAVAVAAGVGVAVFLYRRRRDSSGSSGSRYSAMVGGEGSGPGNEASKAAGIGSLELGYQTAIAAQHPPQPSIASPQAAPSRVVHQATTGHPSRAGQQGAPVMASHTGSARCTCGNTYVTGTRFCSECGSAVSGAVSVSARTWHAAV